MLSVALIAFLLKLLDIVLLCKQILDFILERQQACLVRFLANHFIISLDHVLILLVITLILFHSVFKCMHGRHDFIVELFEVFVCGVFLQAIFNSNHWVFARFLIKLLFDFDEVFVDYLGLFDDLRLSNSLLLQCLVQTPYFGLKEIQGCIFLLYFLQDSFHTFLYEVLGRVGLTWLSI